MATIVYWFHNTSVEIMSREEEVNTIQGAGCAARTSHREIFSNSPLLDKLADISSFVPLLSLLSVVTELIPFPLLSGNHPRWGLGIIWIYREEHLARQQASNAPANWKTATTAREAARAGTVPARRTEKQPDSICRGETWECCSILFNLRKNSCRVETEIRTGEIGWRAAGRGHLEQKYYHDHRLGQCPGRITRGVR